MSRPVNHSRSDARLLSFVLLWLVACAPHGGEGFDVDGVAFGLEDPTAKFSAAASSNYKAGNRSDKDIEYIVVHTMQGYYNGSISWFRNPSSKVSAHYLIRSSDGEVTQMVDVRDVAYHDACFNANSIGLEHEGFIDDADVWYTDVMYESSARLSAWLAETYGIPLDRAHILGHGETDDCSDHTDPGPDWDWDKYMTLIREAAEPTLAAKLVQYEVPETLAPGEMANVWFELLNESSDVLDEVRTRVATAEPSGRESSLFVQGVWQSKSIVVAPDAPMTEPGSRVRFSFPIVAPLVAEGTVLHETFQLVHEGRSFGPLLPIELTVQTANGMVDPPEAPQEDAGTMAPPEASPADEPADGRDADTNQSSAKDPIAGGMCSVGPPRPGMHLGLLGAGLLLLVLWRRRRTSILLSVLIWSACTEGKDAKSEPLGSCADCDGSRDPARGVDAEAEPADGPHSARDAGTGPADPADASFEQADLVDVSHRRELRGVWIASVGNINFPSAQGLSVSAQKKELDSMVEAASAHGINALFFQVRPEADALYESELEPWSRFLTGTQGKAPGYDPLAYVIERAHARGIELHAWLNPYRASSSAARANAANHVATTLSEHVYKYGSLLWMDPAVKAVQDHTRAVVRDLVTRYAVDGIHFDDYFYPYPDGTAFPDASTYSAYKNGGGTLPLGDFRRAAVHTLLRGVSEDLRALKPHVLFGISPFGIYRPGMPAGIEGLDQYAQIYADPLKWVEAGWVDYLAPQLYWPTTQTKQAYEKLLDFWAEQCEGRCLMYAGNNPTNLGKSGWDLAEMKKQISLGRADGRTTHGNVFFTIAPIANNVLKFGDALAQDLYAKPALSDPALRWADAPKPTPPVTTFASGRVRLSPVAETRAYVLYAQRDEGWIIERIIPAQSEELTLEAGTWALTRVTTAGLESRGVRLSVPSSP